MPEPVVAPRWIVPDREPFAESILVSELGISSLLAGVLVRRNLRSPEQAHRFLNPSSDDLHDPFQLPDMRSAVSEILGAKERDELIFIHGDYDADGVTSTALFARCLSRIGCRVHPYVPHRMKQGYGMSRTAVQRAHELGAKLFLTCDCGIGSLAEVELANELGMRVVVTDHHPPGEQLPSATAVVNPHRKDSTYPNPDLCGVGIAFKVGQALASEVGVSRDNYVRAFLDLAAIGTVSDVMPLTGENRAIVKIGLKQLADSQKPGIQELKRVAEVGQGGKPITARDIGFGLGPRINAAGRIGDADLSLRLLLSQDSLEASRIADQLEAINTARKAEQERIIGEAIEAVLEAGLDSRTVIALAKSGWHPGIVGLAAGKVTERFWRPTFLAARDEETGLCSGSARSIPGFDVGRALHAHGHLISSGGGHPMAAGFKIEASRFDEFADSLERLGRSQLSAEDLIPREIFDLEVEAGETTMKAIEDLSLLEPYGMGNEEPKFLVRQVRFEGAWLTRNQEVGQAKVSTGSGTTIRCVGFGLGERMAAIQPGDELDVAFRPSINEYEGRRSVQWKLIDFRAPEATSLPSA